MAQLAVFKYKNHRGEVAERIVSVESIAWLPKPGFGYQPGFFLNGICLAKQERRSFAFVNMEPPDCQGTDRPYYLIKL